MTPKPVMVFVLFMMSLGIAMAALKTTSQNKSGGKMSKNGLYFTKQAPAQLPPTEIADFAAGCFWGVEEEFRKLPGVVATAVGFEGGHTANPTYPEVCTETTGHAETVRVEFDPHAISYAKLLEVFWALHDPTTLNSQGPDFGDQYRSAIFYQSPSQKEQAQKSKEKLQASGELGQRKIVTEITPTSTFTKAEEYHQQYVEKGGYASCHMRKKI